MITTTLPRLNAIPSAAIKMGIVSTVILLITIGGVVSLRANLTTTYSVTTAAN